MKSYTIFTSLKNKAITIKNSMFLKKMILTYIVCTSFVFCAFTFVISSLIHSNFMSSLDQLNNKTLLQSANTTSVTLENLYNFFYIDTLENSNLIKLLFADSYQPSGSIASQRLGKELLNYSNLVRSFYIVNFKGNFVCSNLDTYTKIDTFYDQDIIDILREFSSTDKVFTYLPREAHYTIFRTEYDVKYISLIFRKFETGYLVINLDFNRFTEMINYNSYNPNSQTLILSGDGYVMADSNSAMFGTNLSSDSLYQEVINRDESNGSFISRLNGTKKLINYRKDELFNIVYLTITQYKLFDNSNTLLVRAIFYSGIATFISLILIFTASWVLYKPINALRNSIWYGKNNPDKKKDEFKYISTSFENIKEDFHILKKNSDKFFKTKRKQILKDLLTGNKYSFNKLIEILEVENIQLDRNSTLIINIYFMNYNNLLKDENEDIALLKYSIENIFQELIPKNYSMEVVDCTDHMACIINYNMTPHLGGQMDDVHGILPGSNPSHLKDLNECLSRLQDMIYQYFSIHISCSVGTVVKSPYDISESYKNAKTANLYQVTNQSEKILFYDNICLEPPELQTYPYKIEKHILDAVKNGENDKLSHYLDEFFEIIYHYNYTEIILYLLTFHASLERMEAKYNITFPDKDDNLTLSILQNEKLYRLKELYMNRCHKSMELYHEIKTHNSMKNEIIKQITDLVDKNIANPELSIDSIAEEVHLSNSYLRNLFKEQTGNTLSNYIIERKLEEICRLLKETNLSVQKIAEQLGFSSRNYAFTFFKNYMGITPNQYRVLHKTNKNNDLV